MLEHILENLLNRIDVRNLCSREIWSDHCSRMLPDLSVSRENPVAQERFQKSSPDRGVKVREVRGVYDLHIRGVASRDDSLGEQFGAISRAVPFECLAHGAYEPLLAPRLHQEADAVETEQRIFVRVSLDWFAAMLASDASSSSPPSDQLVDMFADQERYCREYYQQLHCMVSPSGYISKVTDTSLVGMNARVNSIMLSEVCASRVAKITTVSQRKRNVLESKPSNLHHTHCHDYHLSRQSCARCI